MSKITSMIDRWPWYGVLVVWRASARGPVRSPVRTRRAALPALLLCLLQGGTAFAQSDAGRRAEFLEKLLPILFWLYFLALRSTVRPR